MERADLHGEGERGSIAQMRLQLEALRHTIGNTPLEEVHFGIGGVARHVFIKREDKNPTDSVKMRTAFALVEEKLRTKAMTPDSILIDSSSGNLGVALAYIGARIGCCVRIVVDPKATEENIAEMRRLGAQVEIVDRLDSMGGYLLTRLERVRALCDSDPRYVWVNQYSSRCVPRMHYFSTGPEIWQQMEQALDAVFLAVSTGGTLAGVATYLRAVAPHTKIIAVDARGSIALGGTPAPRKLTGIGASRPSDFIAASHYDQLMLVGDEESFAFCRALHAATNLWLGGSSGAVLAACARYLQAHPEASRVLCLSPDGGQNYAGTIYRDEWLAQHALDTSPDKLYPVESISRPVPS